MRYIVLLMAYALAALAAPLLIHAVAGMIRPDRDWSGRVSATVTAYCAFVLLCSAAALAVTVALLMA